jgi:hypothetical protein
MENVSMQLSDYTGDEFTFEGKAKAVNEVNRNSFYPLKKEKTHKIPKDTEE